MDVRLVCFTILFRQIVVPLQASSRLEFNFFFLSHQAAADFYNQIIFFICLSKTCRASDSDKECCFFHASHPELVMCKMVLLNSYCNALCYRMMSTLWHFYYSNMTNQSYL